MRNLEELAHDHELVIGVNPHAHHVDVAQFRCDQVLHCVHVLLAVVGNPPRSGAGALEPGAFALPKHSRHHNVIAYREMRQSLAAIPHAVPLKPTHRRIDPRCPVPSRWAHTNSRFFRESAPALSLIHI